MANHDRFPGPWSGWYFKYDYLCSPNGDRFTPEGVIACVFLQQMQEFKLVCSTRPFGWRC